MSGKPAARVGDMHTCPMVNPGPVPHVGGPILGPGAPTVLVGGMPAARLSDKAQCVGGVDAIAKGAFPVPIEKKPAARLSDSTAHGGVVVAGCPTVLIGLSGVAGNVYAGTKACRAMAKGRSTNGDQQNYGNCGIESSRQIIDAANPATRTAGSYSELGLLQEAINNGDAGGWFAPDGTLLPSWSVGGTSGPDQVAIFGASGVPASTIGAGTAALGPMQDALSNGQAVIANLDASIIWGDAWKGGPNAWHAVDVTGVEYDDLGNPTKVHYNDTGNGKCGEERDYSTFEKAMKVSPIESVATTQPVW